MIAQSDPAAAQSGRKTKLAIGCRESIDEMSGIEIGLAIDPSRRGHGVCARPTRGSQRRIDKLPSRHFEPWMIGAETLRPGRTTRRGSDEPLRKGQ